MAMLPVGSQLSQPILLSLLLFLFTLGMVMVDGTNGIWINHVYQMAVSGESLRKWNITATVLAALYATSVFAMNVIGLLIGVEPDLISLTYAIIVSYVVIWLLAAI